MIYVKIGFMNMVVTQDLLSGMLLVLYPVPALLKEPLGLCNIALIDIVSVRPSWALHCSLT